jgi:hypothetical protein
VVTHRHLATIQLRTRRAKTGGFVTSGWLQIFFAFRQCLLLAQSGQAIATAFSSGGLLRSSPSPTKVPPLVPARREPRRLGSGCQIETGATMIGVLLALRLQQFNWLFVFGLKPNQFPNQQTPRVLRPVLTVFSRSPNCNSKRWLPPLGASFVK